GYALSDATAIRFVAIDRLNSLLVITPNATVFPEVEKWIDRLDQRMAADAAAAVRTFIYHVKNAKAGDLQKVLAQLYGTPVQLSSIYQTPGNVVPVPSGGAPVAPASPPVVGANPPAQPAAGTAIAQTGAVKIISDDINNALLVQTTPQLWADVE